MCNRKPGTRCSGDTRANFLRAETLLYVYEKDTPHEELDISKKAYLEEDLQDKKIKYYATTGGFKDLEKEINSSKNKNVAVTTIQGKGKIVFNAEAGHNIEPVFAFPVWKTDLLQAELEAANSHYNWQKKALKTLEDLEKNRNSLTAVAYAETLMESLTDDQYNMRQAAKLLRSKAINSANILSNTTQNLTGVKKEKFLNSFGPRRISKLMAKEHKFNISAQYAGLKILDLKSYIEDTNKKTSTSAISSIPNLVKG